MNLVLTRKDRNLDADSLIGEIFLDGDFECYSIERLSLAIPEGEYPIELYFSPRLQYQVGLLKDVPGREAIEIHVANYPKDVIGCIGPGQQNNGTWVSNSRLAFQHLMDEIRSAVNTGEDVTIKVQG